MNIQARIEQAMESVEFTGEDTAKAVSYVRAWHRFVDHDKPDMILWGEYHDRWERIDGTSLHVEPGWPGPVVDALAFLTFVTQDLSSRTPMLLCLFTEKTNTKTWVKKQTLLKFL